MKPFCETDLEGETLEETRENLKERGFRKACEVAPHRTRGVMVVEKGQLTDERIACEIWVSYRGKRTLKLVLSSNGLWTMDRGSKS